MKTNQATLDTHLDTLRLPFLKEHCQPLAATAAKNSLPHLGYLAGLIEGEATQRADRAVVRRIQAARFPVIKTLDTFRWDWPKKINRLQIQDLFRLQFIHDHANVILLGTVGLGKTHLATALGYAACQQGMSVLFANAIDVINTLHAAQTKGTLKTELRKYTNPALLILDEVGYLPIDQRGADLLFQVISARYERGSIILTTNKAFKQWPTIFNGDSTITSAVLDRLLHHGHTVVLEGSSYRMKDRAESWKTPPLTPQKPMPGHPIFKLPESSDVHAAARILIQPSSRISWSLARQRTVRSNGSLIGIQLAAPTSTTGPPSGGDQDRRLVTKLLLDGREKLEVGVEETKGILAHFQPGKELALRLGEIQSRLNR